MKAVSVRVDGHLSIQFDRQKRGEHDPVLKELKAECVFMNPKYLQLLKAGKKPGSWCPKHVRAFSIADFPVSFEFMIDRGFYPGAVSLLKKHGYSVGVNDLRDSGSQLFEPYSRDLYLKDGTVLTLRSDQGRVVGDVLSLANSGDVGVEQGMITAPTGAGKTVIGMSIIKSINLKACIIVHTLDLAKQWKREIEEKMRVKCGMIGGGKWDDARYFNVVVAMAQTLHKNMEKWQSCAGSFGLLLTDEAHHGPALQWRGLCWTAPCKHRYGLTATPVRADGLTPLIHLIFGKTLSALEITEVRNLGGVSEVHVSPYILRTKDNMNMNVDPKKMWTDFISKLIADDERNKHIASIAIRASSKMKVLVLTERIAHAQAISAMIPGSVLAHGKLKGDIRDKAFDDMKTADVTVATTEIVGEGIDVPGWNALVLATPISSFVRLSQRLGRIMRVIAGTNWAYVADIIDDNGIGWSSFHKRMTTYRKLKCAVAEKKLVDLR